MRTWLTAAMAIVTTFGAAGCGGGPERAPELGGECLGRGCATPAAAQGTVGGRIGAPSVGPGGQQAVPQPEATGVPLEPGNPANQGAIPMVGGITGLGGPTGGAGPVGAERLGGQTGMGAAGPLRNPSTTGPGFGVIPNAGPGPGIGPGSGPGGSGLYGGIPSPQLGPVCPALQPTPGAPCDPTANSFACTYGQRTCYCSSAWNCM